MKLTKNMAVLLTIVCLAATLSAQKNNDNEEGAAVKKPLELYMQAHATGNGDLIRQAFTPDARILFVRDGKYQQLTRDEFAARFNGRPPADEPQRKRRIASLDITGNAATAKIVLDYPATTFTDYMSLLKIDGEWKIVNKTFHSEPKPKP
jgi:hypothetical protein